MKLINVLLNESNSGDKLAMGIYKAIDSIDPNLNYRDFASAVATVIKNEYGTHNIEPFMKELHSHLGIQEVNEANTSGIDKITITYTDAGRFYKTVVTTKDGKQSKLYIEDTDKLFSKLGIKGELERVMSSITGEKHLDDLTQQLQSKGIQADWNDSMDVS